jgi:SsrA-binding protein
MKLIQKNKKASFEYTFIDEYSAGIKLLGSEVKSIRDGNVNIKNAHCIFEDGELYIVGMHVAEYKESGTHQNHDPIRKRKLLLKKKELKKLKKGVEVKGNTIVPKALLLSKTGFFKLELALATGKKLHDKKHSLKEKAIDLTEKRENKNTF